MTSTARARIARERRADHERAHGGSVHGRRAFFATHRPRLVRNAGSRLQIAAARIFDILVLWQARGRQRRTLARFDDHMLRDIGRTRAEAARECAKPVWRA